MFFKDPHENFFHTYSCYERGLDMLNAATICWTLSEGSR